MFTVRRWLPESARIPLWGDRGRWGLEANFQDPCWKEWERRQLEIYLATQREGIGNTVNDAGYKVMQWVSMREKKLLEVGPGDVRHASYWCGIPAEVVFADVRDEMLNLAEKKMSAMNVPCTTTLIDRSPRLPFEEASFDCVVSFYSLEHLFPLQPYLNEIKRVLRPGGAFIGAIPAEGGLAWGLGRMLTTRRWFKRNTNIDLDKIICWEHPNYADQILACLDKTFSRQKVSFWPLPWLPLVDSNLVIKFFYQKH